MFGIVCKHVVFGSSWQVILLLSGIVRAFRTDLIFFLR